MRYELTIVIDQIEKITCKTHGKTSKIKLGHGRIEISTCCKEHKQLLERKIEYEMYELLNNDPEEVETLLALKQAV